MNLITLLENYKDDNRENIITYIQEHPQQLYILYKNELPIYTFAATISFNCLKTVHEGYLSYLKKIGQKNLIIEPSEVKGKFYNRNIHNLIYMNLYQSFLYLVNVVKVDPLITGDNNNNILHFACKYDNEKVVKYIIKNFPILINQINDNSETPLFIAIKKNNYKIVKMLLDSRKAKIIIDNKQTNKIINIHKYATYYCTYEIKVMFNRFMKKMRDKSRNIDNLNRRKKEIISFEKDAYGLCSDMQTLNNKYFFTFLRNLAKRMHVKFEFSDRYSELCKKIIARLRVYNTNPRIEL